MAIARGTGPSQCPTNGDLGRLAFQDYLNFNPNGTPAPTIASATTIQPMNNIVFISGTTAVVTITPPPDFATAGGFIILIPTGVFTTTTAGNIALASTAVVSKALIMTYDPGTGKWYPSY